MRLVASFMRAVRIPTTWPRMYRKAIYCWNATFTWRWNAVRSVHWYQRWWNWFDIAIQGKSKKVKRSFIFCVLFVVHNLNHLVPWEIVLNLWSLPRSILWSLPWSCIRIKFLNNWRFFSFEIGFSSGTWTSHGWAQKDILK